MYEEEANKIKLVQPAVELYTTFMQFLIKQTTDSNILSALSYLIENGNTTTYEFIYGEKPLKIEETSTYILDEVTDNTQNNEIDFGDNIAEIDFGDEIVIENPEVIEQNIDWGSSRGEYKNIILIVII